MEVILSIIFTPEFLFSVIRVTTPILLGGLAAIISDKAGVVNIGIDGIMLFSALAGVLGSSLTNTWGGFFIAILVGMIMALVLAYFTLELKTNIILGGIAMNMFATGGSVFFLYLFTGDKGNSSSISSGTMPSVEIPIIKDIPYIGEIISGHNIITYMAFLLMIGLYILLNKTSLGMKIRAVGENEHSAQSVGINVKRIRYLSLALSGALAGMAGAFLSMAYYTGFIRGMSADRGWIALAAEAMGRATVLGTAIASFIFGTAEALTYSLSLYNIPSDLIGTLPYITTVVGLAGYAIYETNKKKKRK